MKRSFSLTLLIFSSGIASHACDLCATSILSHSLESRRGLYLGVTEQFTRYNTLQLNGSRIPNPADEKLDSSITQIFVGYNITRRVGIQINVPLIHREFRRVTEGGIDDGTVAGIGDVTALVDWRIVEIDRADVSFRAKLFGGIKFPTGDSDRLAEEAAEDHGHAEEPAHEEEEGHSHADEHEEVEHVHEVESGVHGHDLALGSGSVDGLVGGSLHLRWRRLFFAGEVQYAIRREGEHDYRYANDLTWSFGPGFFVESGKTVFHVQAICAGDLKGADEFRGGELDDTSLNSVFVGGKISATWKDRFSSEVRVEIPVHVWNSAVQIVPDYRVRAAISWSF